MTERTAVRLLTAVLLLGIAIIFCNLWSGSLEDWDEARTAERAREILVLGDWLTIHWNYQPDFIKPPLYYWLTALVYQVIGVSEFGARLWSALFGVLGFYAVYRLGKVVFSAAVGAVAAALLLTIPYYLAYARIAMLDTGLLSFGVLALCAFLSQAPLWGWAFLGIGFMIKGPWIFFYALPLPLWWLTQKDWRLIRDPKFYLGVVIFLVIVLPWHLVQYAVHGQTFFDSYVGHQIMRRIQQPLGSHRQGPFFYFVQLLAKWHVWIYWFITGHFVVGWQGKDGRKLAFLDLWILLVLLSFTLLISTKRTRYLVLVYPALAVVVAYYILYAVEHLRWGKQWLALSIAISVALFLYLHKFRLDFNAEVKMLGQVVQQYPLNAQPVLAFQVMKAVIVFYCRRPVQAVSSPEELLQILHSDSLVILTKEGTALSSLEQHGIKFRTLYEGPTYLLVTPSGMAGQASQSSE
ncbi:MAG TPA: glycosyltransferase family 39 protein [Candidatus Binatia bacterium]|nr:glycosyltransferase family 39 protein [Candidatus Binatia bacterium]